MGIVPYKTFTFDGVSSSAYGVYLTGEGVFNAPERSVEMIEIPGRNGNFALDQGRFQNISVTYKVGMFDTTETNFATKVANFRNWLCSKVGYVRLSDDYNPDEYRMAVYMNGFELEHDFLIAGEAEITFECKPQRWLTSGETATAVANNGTLTNPTLFASSPLLELWGYGKFGINGEQLEIVSGPIGWIFVSNAYENQGTTGTTTIDTTYANVGDDIRQEYDGVANFYGIINCGTDTVSSVSSSNTGTWWCKAAISNGSVIYKGMWMTSDMFHYGTASTTSTTQTITITLSNSTTKTATVAMSIAYDGDDTFTLTQTATPPTGYSVSNQFVRLIKMQLNSSKTALGAPIYFDLDVGEAYKIENDVPVSVNSAVTIPSDLPKLPPGTNTFTYDNTITQFKVTPRWWKV